MDINDKIIFIIKIIIFIALIVFVLLISSSDVQVAILEYFNFPIPDEKWLT